MSYYFTILSPTDTPLFNIAFGTSKGVGMALPASASRRQRIWTYWKKRNGQLVECEFNKLFHTLNRFCKLAPIPESHMHVEEFPKLNNPHSTPHTKPPIPELTLSQKHIDTYPPAAAYITAFLTPSGARFLLLHQPPNLPSSTSTGSGLGSSSLLGTAGSTTRASSSSIAANPTSPQTEEAVRQFMNEVYESYVKTAMNPFYKQGMEIKSPVFRSRVTAAGKKWL
ncbi:Sedlin [Penicillium cf. griseofulvum]|nr:Sedlin [Penicillium cf. griseofulvum]